VEGALQGRKQASRREDGGGLRLQLHILRENTCKILSRGTKNYTVPGFGERSHVILVIRVQGKDIASAACRKSWISALHRSSTQRPKDWKCKPMRGMGSASTKRPTLLYSGTVVPLR
jgi:hypothetical protein